MAKELTDKMKRVALEVARGGRWGEVVNKMKLCNATTWKRYMHDDRFKAEVERLRLKFEDSKILGDCNDVDARLEMGAEEAANQLILMSKMPELSPDQKRAAEVCIQLLTGTGHLKGKQETAAAAIIQISTETANFITAEGKTLAKN
jgi:hypothetical protein